MLRGMNRSLAVVSSALFVFSAIGCSGLFGGPGEPCDNENDCKSGLTCFEGYCTGSGTIAAGDPCEDTVDCTPGSICWNDICLGVGALRFSLAWDVDTDFDLHVETPNGSHIYYESPTGDGGELDVDDCIGGSCVNQDGTHVENIVFSEDPPSGTYTYWVHNFSGTESGSFEIEVFSGADMLASNSGTLPAEDADSTHYTVNP